MHNLDAKNGQSGMTDSPCELLPCPFCGGPVAMERTIDKREWWGIVCRNTLNLGGSCAVSIRPSASKEAAAARWNRRAAMTAANGQAEQQPCLTREQWSLVNNAAFQMEHLGETWFADELHELCGAVGIAAAPQGEKKC